MPLEVFTAIAGFDDIDALSISRKNNERLLADGCPGGHRGVGLYLCPSAQLQKARMRECGFKLEQEKDRQWMRFSELYTAEMRESYRKHAMAWTTLLTWERVVILSREEEAPRAVRTILAQWILPKLGARYVRELG